MKIFIKEIILILLIITCLVTPCIAQNETSNTTQYEKPSWDNFWESGAGLIKEGQKDMIGEQTLTSEFSGIIQVLVIASVIILLSATIIIGIKYMVAEPKEQAELKKKLVGVVIATTIIAGAYTIWSFTYNFMASAEQQMIQGSNK